MKKLIVSVTLGLCLSLSFGAMASPDDEVTIRVMEMHEHSKDSVMQLIELPARALERSEQHNRTGEGDVNMEQERERERIRKIEAEAEHLEIEHEHEGFGGAGEQFQEGLQGASPNN
ncbi:hypothetical protein ACFL3P_03300 [Pseudomonadota bacterium]